MTTGTQVIGLSRYMVHVTVDEQYVSHQATGSIAILGRSRSSYLLK